MKLRQIHTKLHPQRVYKNQAIWLRREGKRHTSPQLVMQMSSCDFQKFPFITWQEMEEH